MSVQLEEAAKRLTIAKHAYVMAIGSIIGQYLKPIIAAGDPAEIDKVYQLLGRVDDIDFSELEQRFSLRPLEQPAAPEPPAPTLTPEQKTPEGPDVTDPSDASGTSSPQE